MNVCNPVTLRAYAPAMVGWCLALAACLRAEQLRGDLHAQALLPVLQGGAVACWCSRCPASVPPASCCGGRAGTRWSDAVDGYRIPMRSCVSAVLHTN